MNVQQLIDKYEAAECVVDFVSGKTLLKNIRRDLKQLDEPKPVKVPQFVADWIEYFKKCSGTLYGSTAPYSYYGRAITDDFEGDVTEVLGWIRDNSEVYARAWLDGYEVEKEKRYIVRVKVVEEDNAFLNYYAPRNEWFMDSSCDMKDIRAFHTRKQLEEAGFGWVFDCPEIEVEEVDLCH